MELMELLKKVSRSFYLTMRVLPRSIRRQISYAYLLARATDTIADTALVNADVRTAALEGLQAAILKKQGASFDAASFSNLITAQSDSSEKTLLENIGQVLCEVEQFSPEDQADIHSVLQTITQGQLLDLKRFVVEGEEGKIRALQTEEELDDYTYRVAGCVGEFWTRICRRHLFPKAKVDEEKFLENAVHFGKGLQLVNILRDLPADLKNGRCYLPENSLKTLGLGVEDLLDPEKYPLLRSYYKWYLSKALFYLQDGAEYVAMTPGGVRTWLARLGCTWPLLIGAKTLKLLGESNPLDAKQRVKVSRKEVKAILWSTVWRGFLPQGWSTLFKDSFGQANKSTIHHSRTPLEHRSEEGSGKESGQQ